MEKMDWESLISLNSGVEPDFNILPPASEHHDTDGRLNDWTTLDYAEALARDQAPLPDTPDREGYYGPDHFSYWASGLLDARYLAEAAEKHGVNVRAFLDFGCASGRVIRHTANEWPEVQTWGCDINRLHVEWCNAHLPRTASVFQNHSVPSLPLPDNSVDLISAFSVFTHIEAFETSWLMEMRRILRPGGLLWATVHSELTLQDMSPDWPLWDPVMTHPRAGELLDSSRNFKGDRMVMRWLGDRSYSSNVFYKQDYLIDRWSRILDVVEFRRRFPSFQDVMLMQKPA